MKTSWLIHGKRFKLAERDIGYLCPVCKVGKIQIVSRFIWRCNVCRRTFKEINDD